MRLTQIVVLSVFSISISASSLVGAASIDFESASETEAGAEIQRLEKAGFYHEILQALKNESIAVQMRALEVLQGVDDRTLVQPLVDFILDNHRAVSGRDEALEYVHLMNAAVVALERASGQRIGASGEIKLSPDALRQIEQMKRELQVNDPQLRSGSETPAEKQQPVQSPPPSESQIQQGASETTIGKNQNGLPFALILSAVVLSAAVLILVVRSRKYGK